MSELSKPLTEKPEPPLLWAVIAVIAGIAALFAASSISSSAARWHAAETALNHWHPVIDKIDQVERTEERRFPQKNTRTSYIRISGTYPFADITHHFQTSKFKEGELRDACEDIPFYINFQPGITAHVHVNPANPAESVFEAEAQVKIFRPKTANERFLATSCGALCIITSVLHYFDLRRFARKTHT